MARHQAPGRRSPNNRRRAQRGTSMVGQRLELTVEAVAHGGHCIARHDGRVVFVRHTAPGERVIARVSDGTAESKFLRADAIEVLEASPHRVAPPCRFSGPGGCGGCDFQHLDVAYQRELKADVLKDAFARIAKHPVEAVVEPLPALGGAGNDGLRWRTRLELGVKHGVTGLREHRSHRLVEIDDCLIAGSEFVPAINDRFDDDVSGLDLVRPSDDDILGIELPLGKNEKIPAISEVVEAKAGTHEFGLSARGFWQVHPAAAATYVDAVIEAARPQPGERCLDLYCGVGLFTRYLADAVGESGHVTGVEVDAEAVGYARTNMAGAQDVDLLAADVAALDWAGSADIVVLDPPRAGAGKAVVAGIVNAAPRVCVYVSCDPASLARDVRYFEDGGYTLETLRAFDAFPMTQHIEAIAVLRPSRVQ